MFAPYCRSCASRVLLGPRRIVTFAWDRGDQRPVVVLRCFCGALLDWDDQPPADGAAVDAHAAARPGT